MDKPLNSSAEDETCENSSNFAEQTNSTNMNLEEIDPELDALLDG